MTGISESIAAKSKQLRAELELLSLVDLQWRHIQVFGKSLHYGQPVRENAIEAIVRQAEYQAAEEPCTDHREAP